MKPSAMKRARVKSMRANPSIRRRKRTTHAGTCPTKKIRFPSWSTAVGAAVRLSSKVGALRIYKCPLCDGFHLTRLREWKGTT